jgi:hypothetical protein
MLQQALNNAGIIRMSGIIPETLNMTRGYFMLKRSIKTTLRLNSQECQQLKKQVVKTGLSQESYLRALINGYIPKELPSPDYHGMMKELRVIGNNLNQIAARANATGHTDRMIFQLEVDQLRQAVLDIQAAATSPERRVNSNSAYILNHEG